jgi:hypothetical protein
VKKGRDKEKTNLRTFVSYASGRAKVAPLPKSPIVFNRLASTIPFGSLRDAAVWLALVITLLPCVYLIVEKLSGAASARGALAGASVGLIWMRLVNLRGLATLASVSPGTVAQLLSRMNYRQVGLHADRRLFKPAGSIWLRWDSNVALVGTDEIEAPLFLLWTLNTRLRSHAPKTPSV